MPIISAEAVAAVRRGLRIALRAGETTDCGREHRHRHADRSRRRAGDDRTEQHDADQGDSSDPRPTSAIALSGDSDAVMTVAIRRRHQAADGCTIFDDGRERSTATSRRAAIGATRLAFIAGAMLATIVTSDADHHAR